MYDSDENVIFHLSSYLSEMDQYTRVTLNVASSVLNRQMTLKVKVNDSHFQ